MTHSNLLRVIKESVAAGLISADTANKLLDAFLLDINHLEKVVEVDNIRS